MKEHWEVIQKIDWSSVKKIIEDIEEGNSGGEREGRSGEGK